MVHGDTECVIAFLAGTCAWPAASRTDDGAGNRSRHECSAGSQDFDANATCTDTLITFDCTCNARQEGKPPCRVRHHRIDEIGINTEANRMSGR